MKKSVIFLIIQFLIIGCLNADNDNYSKIKVIEKFIEKFAEENENLSDLLLKSEIESNSLTAPLRRVYPDFAEALKAASDEPSDGIDKLLKLSNSDNDFLASEASYYLARLLIGEGRYEESLPHLKKIRDQWRNETLRFGEVLYYQGLSYSNMLQRTAASDSLHDFVENHPNESPRLLGAALDIIASLERVNRGSIDDVASHMEFSRRKLGLKDVGENTQVAQFKIIEMLDELIKRAEEQENPPPPNLNSSPNQGNSQGQAGNGQGNGQNNSQQGNPSAQNPPRVVRRVRGAAESAWDDLRKRDRGADALGALKSKYPARYKMLVEQYYRSVQGGNKK